jgi:FR47-like protein
VSKGIQECDEVPFLHVLDGNLSAIALYEKLGFTFRAALQLTVMTRASSNRLTSNPARSTPPVPGGDFLQVEIPLEHVREFVVYQAG